MNIHEHVTHVLSVSNAHNEPTPLMQKAKFVSEFMIQHPEVAPELGNYLSPAELNTLIKCLKSQKFELPAKAHHGTRQTGYFQHPYVMNFNAPFDGADYNHARDHARLKGQLERIFNLMKDGEWRTLQEIADITKDPTPSVSAQLRGLRRPKFGSHTVNRRYLGNGLYEYQLIVRLPEHNHPLL